MVTKVSFWLWDEIVTKADGKKNAWSKFRGRWVLVWGNDENWVNGGKRATAKWKRKRNYCNQVTKKHTRKRKCFTQPHSFLVKPYTWTWTKDPKLHLHRIWDKIPSKLRDMPIAEEVNVFAERLWVGELHFWKVLWTLAECLGDKTRWYFTQEEHSTLRVLNMI